MCRTMPAVAFVSGRLNAFSYACVFQKLEQVNKKLVEEFVECPVKPCLCVYNEDSYLKACGPCFSDQDHRNICISDVCNVCI